MNQKLKCIGSSILITLSFVFGIEVILHPFHKNWLAVLLPATAAHIFGNIGGYIPTVTKSLSAATQYVTAIGFLTAAIVFCVILSEKRDYVSNGTICIKTERKYKN